MIGELLKQLDHPFTGEQLFDHLTDVVFFIKDAAGAYLVVNQTLVERCGVAAKKELIGRTAYEVLQAPLGQRFLEQDHHVLRSGEPLLSRLELHLHPNKEVGWCMTTKLPLRKRSGEVIGLVGVSQDLRLPDFENDEYAHVVSAIRFAEKNLQSRPTVQQLARAAKMSRFQLDRRMRRVFGVTTGQWLMKTRIDLAQRLLSETDQSIASVAQESGYADQSAFTRQFRRATGISPREYRRARRESD